MAITPLPSPPSRADAANFSDRADAFMAQLPTFANEANALQADVNSKQTTASTAATTATTKASEASVSASNAASSASSASTSATNANNSATAAQNWAIKTDGPVSGSEYSAKYWGQIAQGFIVGTLFDDNSVSTVKTWSSNKISTWCANIANGNTFTAQNVFAHSGNPANSTSYAVKTTGSYGGGYLIQDDNNHIGMYSVGGTLNLGFGANSTSIASKYTFTSSGDFTASGKITGNADAAFQGQVTVTSPVESTITLGVNGYDNLYIYSNTLSYGFYSNTGGSLIMYDRGTGKKYFAGIDSDSMWTNNNTLFVPGTFGNEQGRIRFPNGYIRQWGMVTVPANSTGNVTFNLVFPNMCLGVNVSRSDTLTNSDNGHISFGPVGQNGVSISNGYNTQRNIFWEAFGH